jgi:tRNA G26 N,N-dimethylase Trm1
MHLMHHAPVFNHADVCATLATDVCSVHATCTDRMALCGYTFKLRERYNLCNRLLSAVCHDHCMLFIMLTLRLSIKPGTL